MEEEKGNREGRNGNKRGCRLGEIEGKGKGEVEKDSVNNVKGKERVSIVRERGEERETDGRRMVNAQYVGRNCGMPRRV